MSWWTVLWNPNPLIQRVANYEHTMYMHDYRYQDQVARVHQTERECEVAVLHDAAAIERKLRFSISSVLLPSNWKYVGEPNSGYLNTECNLNILQQERPVRPCIEFRQVCDIFECFDALILPRQVTLSHDLRKNVVHEIKKGSECLLYMTKAAIFTDEPAVFFFYNWPLILLVLDKLLQVRLIFPRHLLIR
jgi:hypothetical protein